MNNSIIDVEGQKIWQKIAKKNLIKEKRNFLFSLGTKKNTKYTRLFFNRIGGLIYLEVLRKVAVDNFCEMNFLRLHPHRTQERAWNSNFGLFQFVKNCTISRLLELGWLWMQMIYLSTSYLTEIMNILWSCRIHKLPDSPLRRSGAKLGWGTWLM